MQMREGGLEPDKFSFTSRIARHCKEGDVVDAFRLKNFLLQTGTDTDLLTYSSLIWGLTFKGLMIEAKELF